MSIRKSVTPDYLIFWTTANDSKPLRRRPRDARHDAGAISTEVESSFNLSPWSRPIPAQRSAFAKNMGLGLRENVNVKRVYEQPADADGTRVLVDRLWPRGLSKQRAAADASG